MIKIYLSFGLSQPTSSSCPLEWKYDHQARCCTKYLPPFPKELLHHITIPCRRPRVSITKTQNRFPAWSMAIRHIELGSLPGCTLYHVSHEKASNGPFRFLCQIWILFDLIDKSGIAFCRNSLSYSMVASLTNQRYCRCCFFVSFPGHWKTATLKEIRIDQHCSSRHKSHAELAMNSNFRFVQ